MDDPDGPRHSPPVRWRTTVGRIVLRLACIVAIALAASWLISYGMTLSETLPEVGQGAAQMAVIFTALLVYVLLIATPFVPGLEIGLALLLVRGLSIAPAVYLATVCGLLLAFTIGRMVPVPTLERTFRDLRLRRAAEMMARHGQMSPEERQTALQNRLPRWLAGPILQYRYLSLIVLINMPGSAIYGGGGGLMMAAGLSRLFEPPKTALTVCIAVLPLPLGFWIFGPMVLGV